MTADDSAPSSIPDPGVWLRHLSSTEAATASALRRIDPQLAGLFERGLRLADNLDEPGIGYLVAHVGRELSRGVVSRLTGETPVRLEPDVENAEGQTRFRKRIAEALDLPETDPHVSSWFRSHQTLVSSAHWRDHAPSSEDIRESFVDLVGLLFGRIAPYFDTQAKLDELLHIDVPSPDDVERLRRCSLRYAQRQYFFSKLTNAGWLQPLSGAGFFRNPPDRLVYEDESWSLQRWPEGEALARLAAGAPDVVLAEFSSIPKDNSNPAIWNGVATAALAMRPTHASCLVPQLVAALKNAPPVLFPGSIVRVIQRLAEAGDRDAAFQLTEALLFVGGKSPRKGSAGRAVKSTTVFLRLDDFGFDDFLRHALPALEAVDPFGTFNLLSKKLALAINAAAPEEGEPYTGYSSVRYRDLNQPDPNDVLGQLASAVASVAVRASSDPQKTEQVLASLDEHEHEIFQRIWLYVLTAVGPLAQERLDTFFRDRASLEPTSGSRETAAVVREQFENASPDARLTFQRALEAGPSETEVERPEPQSDERADGRRHWQRRRLTWFRDRIPTPLQDLAQQVGVTGERPSPEEEGLAEDGFYVGGGGFVGDRSPVSVEQLANLGPADFVEYLITWCPEPSSFPSPTRERLDGTLVEYATSQPAEALQRALSLVDRLTDAENIPGYVHSLLRGIHGAIEAGTPIDWTEAFRLVGNLVPYIDAQITLEPTGTLNHRPWRWLSTEVVEFLTAACRKNVIPRAQNETLWLITEEIIRSRHTWNTDNDEPFTSFGDVLTGAMNTAAGRTTEMLLEVALVTFRTTLGVPENDATDEHREAAKTVVAPKLRSLLEQVLGWTGSRAVVAQAVVGMYVPQIHFLDREWMIEVAPRLFENGTSEPLGYPAWGGYVTHARLFTDVFADLRPWYERAASDMPMLLDGSSQPGDHWSLTKHLAQHVCDAFMRGLIEIDDHNRLLETVFGYLPGSERVHISWRIFRGWSDATRPVSAQHIARLVQFWRWRLDQLEDLPESDVRQEDLRGLTWFVRTPYMPDEDVLTLGLRTLLASGGEAIGYGVIWEPLARLADVDASRTFRMAELLIEAALGRPHPPITFEQTQHVLACALAADDVGTRDRSVQLIHTLGEKGYVEFGRLLEGQ